MYYWFQVGNKILLFLTIFNPNKQLTSQKLLHGHSRNTTIALDRIKMKKWKGRVPGWLS